MSINNSNNIDIHKDLFRLVRNKKWEYVIERAGIFPEEASIPYSYTFNNGVMIYTLPIHLACMKNAPLKVILSLIAADPKTCEYVDNIGRTPLHHALRYGTTNQIVKVFTAIYTRAVFLKSHDGTLPIHLACLHATSHTDSILEYIQIVKHLLSIHPRSLMEEDEDGFIPRDNAYMIHDEILREAIIHVLDTFEADNGIDQRSELVRSHTTNDRISNRNDNCDEVDKDEDNIDRVRTFEVEESNNNDDDRTDTDHEYQDKVYFSNQRTISTTKQCVICMERNVSHVLIPCGHPCLCNHCASDITLTRMKWKCPECRTNVYQAMKFFGRVVDDDE